MHNQQMQISHKLLQNETDNNSSLKYSMIKLWKLVALKYMYKVTTGDDW